MSSPIVGRAIAQVTDNHRLDPVTDRRKAQGPCELKSGHEVTFVSLVAQYLFEELERQARASLKYHQWVYMPSRRAEGRVGVGYDLSIGQYSQHRRVRSMHKLLLSWCDNRRSWTLSPRSIDHTHLENLRSNWESSPDNIRPYLVLHLCYCTHDYRRMGMDAEIDGYNVVLPGIQSLLRTVVMPLDQLFLQVNGLDDLSVRYYRNLHRYDEQESPQAYLDRIAARQNHHAVAEIDGERVADLCILTLDRWRDEAVKFLVELDRPA